MQVVPIKPTLKVPGTKHLKPQYEKLLSNCAFSLNLRHYSKGVAQFLAYSILILGVLSTSIAALIEFTKVLVKLEEGGRGLHSSTFQLNLSRFGHTSPCPPV